MCFPVLFNLDILIFQDNPIENLNTAFDVAEKHLDIPRMLDPEGKTENRLSPLLELLSTENLDLP